MNEPMPIRTPNPPIGSVLLSAVQLTRPLNCALTAISVWVGAVTSGGIHASYTILFAGLGAAAIAAAGNGMNDVIDLEVDGCNRPHRPLPSGRLSVGAALALSALLGVTGLMFAFVAGMLPGMIAFVVVTGLALYNWLLKRVGLAGNVLVSLIAAATFPYGAAAAGVWGRWWIPALFAVFYHLARELVKGVEDTEGDGLAGVRTMARVCGGSATCRVAAILLGIVGITAPLPGLLGVYGVAYLIPVLALDIFLIRLVRRLWSGLLPGDARLSPQMLVGMLLGLTAVLLGEFLDRT
jgi:geranylgeranylglycerol-phosphate geranylgeranyltransferase